MNPRNPMPDCPVCGEPLQKLAIWTSRPQFCHIGVCLHCTTVICRSERPVRVLTEAEFRAFDPDDLAEIQRVQGKVRQHNRLN